MLCPTSSAEGSSRKELCPQSQTLIPSPWRTYSMSLLHSREYSCRPFLGAHHVPVSSSKSFERSVDLCGCFGNAHAHRRVTRGSVPAETASKKSHRYPDGSSLPLPSHGSWIVSSPFYATSQACFCSAASLVARGEAGSCSTVARWPLHNRVSSTICPPGNSSAS